MVYLLIHLISIVAVWAGSLVGFNDATVAINDGVYSATSIIGYSITKSIFLYFLYLSASAVSAFVYIKFIKKNSFRENVVAVEKVVFKKSEIIMIFSVVVFFAFMAIALREKIFDQNSLYSEEFYNLSALNELRSGSFDIIYPYSVGNLLVINILSKLGIGFIIYKIFLNSVALFALYASVGYFFQNISKRLMVYFWIIILYLQSILSPSFHRNILRYFLPVFFIMALAYVVYKGKKPVSIFALLAGSVFAVLFFGSADNIVIAGVLYFLAILFDYTNKKSWKNSLLFLLAPAFSILLMFIVFSSKYFSLIINQIKSITFYSGHANSVPFFNLYSIFSQNEFGSLVKNLVYAPVYYLPVILLGSLVIYIILNFKRYGLKHPVFGLLVLFTVAYSIIFRQNFGDSGVGRIAITSTVLFFAILSLNNLNSETTVKNIVRLGFVFFFILTAIGLYFFRYNADYFIANYKRERNPEDLVLCDSNEYFSKKLIDAGFLWCEADLVSQLSALGESLNGRSFYVFDDTFSLYYLLGKRPIALIPAYYMAYDKQLVLVKKMNTEYTAVLIYPRKSHFFGVPDTAVGNKNFMTNINDYRDEKFKKKIELKNYDLYLR